MKRRVKEGYWEMLEKRFVQNVLLSLLSAVLFYFMVGFKLYFLVWIVLVPIFYVGLRERRLFLLSFYGFLTAFFIFTFSFFWLSMYSMTFFWMSSLIVGFFPPEESLDMGGTLQFRLIFAGGIILMMIPAGLLYLYRQNRLSK